MLQGGSIINSSWVLLLTVFLRPLQLVTDCQCEMRCNDGETCRPTLDVQIIYAEISDETVPRHNETLTLKAICTNCAVVNVTSLLYDWSVVASNDPHSPYTVSQRSSDTWTLDLRNVVYQNISLTVTDSKCRCIWGHVDYSLDPRSARISETDPSAMKTVNDVQIKVLSPSEDMSLVDAAAAMTHSQVVTSLQEHLANGDMEGAWMLITKAAEAIQDTFHDVWARQQRHSELLLEVANFDTTNVERLGVKAALMERAVLLLPHITSHAKATVVGAFEDMTTRLLQLSRDALKHNNTFLLDRKTFENTVCAVLRAAVNTMKLTLKTDTEDVPGQQQQRDIGEKTVQLVERLSSALLNVRPPHAKPLLLSTPHFTLRLFKERLEDLTTLQLPALSHHLTGRRSDFQLPRLTFLAAHHKVVGIQLLHWSSSPYSWSEAVAGVGSEVVDLTVLDQAGEPLSLTRLKDPVLFEWSTSADTADPSQLVGTFTVHPTDTPHQPSDHLVSTFSIQVPVGKTYRVHFSCESAASCHHPLLIAVTTDSLPTAEDFVEGRQGLIRADFHSSFTKTLKADMDGHNIVRHLVADTGSFAMLGNLPSDAIDRTLFFGFMYDAERAMGSESEMIRVRPGGEAMGGQSVDYDTHPYVVTVTATLLDCLYWNKRLSMWKNDGCWVRANSNASHIKCQCDHMTPFAGASTNANTSIIANTGNITIPENMTYANMTYAPTDIDASNTTDTTEKSEYPDKIVLSTVLVTWFIYIIILMFAWHKDKEDAIKACLTVLSDNKRCALNPYLVSVMTGWRYHGGTRATVYMYLNGVAGGSVRRQLSDATRPLFEAGGEDWFLLATRKDLGDLTSLQVWHVGSRARHPDWFVNQISVYCLRTHIIWHFICDDWIAATSRGEAIKPKTLLVDDINADKDYVFWYRLFLNLIQCSREYHICLSVFSRQPYNSFTRVQRATSYMTFLCSAMLTNLLWYHLGQESVSFIGLPAIIGTINVLICGVFLVVINVIFRKVEMPQPKADPDAVPEPVHGIILNEHMAKIGTTFQSKPEVFYDIAGDFSENTDMQYATSRLTFDVDTDDSDYDSKTQLVSGEDVLAAPSGDLGKMLLKQRMARLSQAGHCGDTFDEMNRTTIARMLLDRRATVLDPSNSNQNALPHPHGVMLTKMKSRNMWTEPPKKYPWWCVFISWGLCMIIIISATAVLIFIGLAFDADLSKSWIKAVLTTVILDLLFLEPLVVIILAVVKSYKGPATPVGHPSQFVVFEKPEPTVTFVDGTEHV